MNLYETNIEIEKALQNAIDPETGEIVNNEAFDLFEHLQGEKKQKMLNVAKYIKSQSYMVDAYKAEKKRVEEKMVTLNNKIERLKSYLMDHFDEKIEDEQVKISVRKSQSVNITNPELVPSDFVIEKTVRSISKADLKKALSKDPESLKDCAVIETKENIQIK